MDEPRASALVGESLVSEVDGNLFESLGAFFSALGFAAIFYAILLQHQEILGQREDLALQYEEMKLATEEHRRAADAHEQSFSAVVARMERERSLEAPISIRHKDTNGDWNRGEKIGIHLENRGTRIRHPFAVLPDGEGWDLLVHPADEVTPGDKSFTIWVNKIDAEPYPADIRLHLHFTNAFGEHRAVPFRCNGKGRIVVRIGDDFAPSDIPAEVAEWFDSLPREEG